MKGFSIRKNNIPDPLVEGYDLEEKLRGNIDQQLDEFERQEGDEYENLTAEEQEKLKPQEIKVVNPWIHEATHKEYLEQVKGLPARHATVIKKHMVVQRERTFIHEHETTNNDAQTTEGLKLLEGEYEIFSDPNLPSTKMLTRFDTWDEEKSIPEWLEYCKERPMEAHALSPVFENGEYIWKPVRVIDYDYTDKKWKVVVSHTNQVKFVTRLSLLFLAEDPEMFKKRVNVCKQQQAIVEAEQRFTALVDSIPVEKVSDLSKERRYNFLSKCIREKDKFEPDKVYNTFKHLMRIVEEEYRRQMKKCIVIRDMVDPSTHAKYIQMKVPLRITRRTAPYYGVVPMPTKFPFNETLDQIIRQHWSSDSALVTMTKNFAGKCIDFQKNRYMKTDKIALKLPRELDDMKKIQNSHHLSTRQNMLIQWREYLVGDIQEQLKINHNFFEGTMETYLKQPLKRIISRFELIMNTYLREFVRLSINDWVSFITDFTVPSEDQLWEMQKNPMIIIHINMNKPTKKTKKDKKKSEVSPEKKEEEEKIDYKPTIEQCCEFFRQSFTDMIESTNKVNVLENDLMPFLQTEEKPNFELTNEFPWFQDAFKIVNEILENNIKAPLELLEKFKAYEDIAKTSKTKMIKELFEGETKATIIELREKLDYYQNSYNDIMNLSNDVVDFPIFRVMAGKMKRELGDQVLKLKDEIMNSISAYCIKTVDEINETYDMMNKKAGQEPKDEKELVEIRDFIKDAPNKEKVLEEQFMDVKKHLEILEDHSFHYDDKEIHKFWYILSWHLEIQASITDGSVAIQNKEVIFMQKLDQDKEKFTKNIEVYQQQFEKIKNFNDLSVVKEYSTEAFGLREQLNNAIDQKQQFNDRESLFAQPLSEYPELKSLDDDFIMFYDLTTMAYEAINFIQDCKENSFIKLDAQDIEKSVTQWLQKCTRLNKKLCEDYPESAAVAIELRGLLEEFNTYTPLIKCLRSDAILDEDWDEIKNVVNNQELDRNDELKLQQMIQLDLMKYIDEIEEVSMRAEKKYQLGIKLKIMREEMKDFKIELFPHKSDTMVIRGYDDINAILDDQIVNAQAMLGSAYMKGRLRVEAKLYEKKLNDYSELIEAIGKTQRGWMYLEPIFASEDIHNQMPNEGAQFKIVDKLWRTTMDAISTECGGIGDLHERDNIKSLFDEANKKLDEIQKQLNDYLEEKRQVFPRFYFLANDDLLMILAQTKEPKAVQPHMDKCFEGIQSLMFNETDCVYGMVSAENEQVEYDTKIDVNEGDKKGNVEKWLLEVESQMRKTLKRICIDSMADYLDSKRVDWVLKWPGQIILAVNQIDWTKGVEDAIRDGTLQKYCDLLQKQIEDVVILVRSDLTTQARITLKAMVVIDVHAKGVVEELIEKRVAGVDEFDWMAQLRYYVEEKETLRVKMVTSTIDYGYEYLGNTARLVITSLTDRCYRTLMGAKYLNYGGAPEGPAGTGKTESVKDLAKALAVQCVVFNCSDGLDYLAMAKFFKGLASSGAWCCFDEFNRIDLEVLSVVAQQILTIQLAIADLKKNRIVFEGTEIKINRACAVNITMNPGYAGRSELPDNLKALFRPCAMMVPDYKLIAEIELYSFGFSNASDIAIKVVASLRLSSEQLSSQYHYDFGMRALKTILTACGNLRMKMDQPEDLIAMRALYDVNLPKFTSNDIPLFLGITSDLFPGMQVPQPNYDSLLNAIDQACYSFNLQTKKEFIKKCIDLYETICVRHGLMLVGKAGSGKSKCLRVLQKAMSSIKDNPDFINVLTYYINPKSLLQEQLYGRFDPDTHEWTDGVLAIRIRLCAESTLPDRKWVVFDGPVDAIWVENMNTVLDDNKKLCLNSGQIIKLKPNMTIMFEVEDLSQASPATVSRCGMIFLEPEQLGHSVLISSYCQSVTDLIKTNYDKFCGYMHYLADVSIAWLFMHVDKFPCPTDPQFLIDSFLNIFDSFLPDFREEDVKIPKEFDEMIPNFALFAMIWSVGGALDENKRPKFNDFLQDVIAGEDVNVKYELDLATDLEIKKIPVKLPEYKSLFDLFYDKEKLMWINWLKTIPTYVIPKEAQYTDLIIPILDNIRLAKMMTLMVNNSKHCLFVGPTGTGKTIAIAEELRTFSIDKWANLSLSFSAQTSAKQTQHIIDGKMDKRRKGVYGPPQSKLGVIFVDDLNMPQPETYGAQPPIELLRQWMDFGGWYDIDTKEKEFREVQSIRFVCAMSPPGGGRNFVSSRYVRHFSMIYVEPYSNDSLQYIFGNIMEWFLVKQVNPAFPKSVQGLRDSLVNSTIMVYQKVIEQFRPTPAKSHYTYNLRDISKVFQGIAKANPKGVRNDGEITKLWAHECMRVFKDRLIDDSDRNAFDALLKLVVKEKYKKEWDKLVEVEPLLFASFVPMIHPDNDETKRPYNDLYTELTDREKMKTQCNSALDEFNSTNPSKKMNLVLFMDAIEHVVKLHRIITTPYGNALLVGVGGSGRKSVTELAASIAVFESMTIEITKGYGVNEFRDDIRKIMFNCGVEFNDTIFLFSDTQIVTETFVEDINNLLNNGEIPNLFSAPEDLQNVLDGIKDSTKGQPNVKNFQDSDYFHYFIERCKQKLHVCLTFSPIGEAFRRRLRMFPSLVNCTTIDWFLPWPKDALQSVAQHFLDDVELDNQDGIVEIFVNMQEKVTALTQRYFQELRRYYYVTPTSYLELIKSFKLLLAKKRGEIDSVIHKYERGLHQLNDAAEQVAILQIELKELEPKLKIAEQETNELIKTVEEQKKEVDEISTKVAAEEEIAKEKSGIAEGIEKDCKAELAKVEPIFQAAVKAVKDLNKNDIVELRGITKPSDGVKCVMKTLCMLFSVKPIKVKGQTAKDVQYDYWEPAKKQLLTPQFLKNCENYDKDNIQESIIKEVLPILNSADYQDSVLEKASKAAHGMAKWVRAIVQFYEAMKIVNPKREQLAGAQADSKEAKALLDEATSKLNAVQEQMQKLMNQKADAEAKKEKLLADTEDCKKKKERAEGLIVKLQSEKENWDIQLERNREHKKHLVGDVVLSSGVMAYLGVFTSVYREDCINTWVVLMNEFDIISTKNYNLQDVLGDQIKIRHWQIKELPQDSFSVDNAIMMEYSERWPLMIDPQMQANNWIKKMEDESGLRSIKPTTDAKKISQTLEICMSQGIPVIFEDCIENIDPMMEPILAKQIVNKGGVLFIKFGEGGLIDYDKKFKFYITTKLSRPHFAPEVCVKVNMLNFMVTEEGLEDQMLQVTVRKEEHKTYMKRIQCFENQAESERVKTELQDRILNEIANATGNLLENEELYNTLDMSKQKCNEIEDELKTMENTLETINKVREFYRPVARRVSRLFFCISDLANVDPMYQYSLKWFTGIFEKSIDRIDKLPDKPTQQDKKDRIGYLSASFTQLLYQNVCRSLFAKDKLLFSFLLCLKIMEERDEIDQTEKRFLMAGGTWAEPTKPNPTGDNGWLLNKSWTTIQEMGYKLPEFAGLDIDFEENIGEWENIYNSSKPQRPDKEPWPGKWTEISIFKRLLILRALRPDKIIEGIQQLVKNDKDLGQEYINPPTFDLQKCYDDSRNTTPIIFILSPGADPMSELKKLADSPGLRKKWESLSLGQGQEKKAIEAIKLAQEMQTWVVLQNCHLSPSFMPSLDAIIEQIEDDPENEFRMWLTSMPSDKFPVSILQNGVKVTNEPPKGLRSNILGSFVSMSEVEFDGCVKQREYKKLVFGLCFFNALVIERRKYGPLGWNIPYEFSASDLRISQAQLADFLNKYDEIPWEALHYMVAEANYGGRVTDPQDRKTINVILKDFYTPRIIEDSYRFSKGGKYYAPPDGTLEQFQDFIKDQIPMNDLTEIFGMHGNADITSAINETNLLLGTVTSLMPRSAGGAGQSQEEMLQQQANDILMKIPEPFDTYEVGKKHPIVYNQSMNTVLAQEILRFNQLINKVKLSLVNIGKAIKGEVVMSAELEEVANAMFDNQVPGGWNSVSYPSLKPLGSWVNDFIKRLEFIQDWIDNGAPAAFWLSGFFFTQSFLTGAKQNYARKYQLPIDSLDFDFSVISDPTKTNTQVPPEDGSYVYGLFLEGCRWDSDNGVLAESHPRVLYVAVPHIHLIPIALRDIPVRHTYLTPIYKTSHRRGTLSTTGHSTNFVMSMTMLMKEEDTIEHWIKRGVAMLTQLND